VSLPTPRRWPPDPLAQTPPGAHPERAELSRLLSGGIDSIGHAVSGARAPPGSALRSPRPRIGALPLGHDAAGTLMLTGSRLAKRNIVKRLNRNYVLHVIGELNKLDIFSIKTYNLSPSCPSAPSYDYLTIELLQVNYLGPYASLR